ncbi:YeeE/YedE thiosulfate transporter family protein [uncultured Corynebacterium sp.]|uniref:YeeE/YedE thiosulfate transporter family protein n=1 Tax=uncultured Corynebacterium sp. TaxID=159447 RepID=UPI00262D5D22|nr:YeeE/YedE thiosulfate transporter family protein [uncultured Corynebacterium sp.]
MLITGLALGAVLGFVMQRGRFCVTGFLRDIFTQRSWRGFVALLIVISVHAIGLAALTSAGVITPEYKELAPLAVIVGGIIFGLGIVLAGGCASGTWYRSGEGLIGSWIALVFYALSAAAMKTGFLGGLQNSLKDRTVGLTSIHASLGISIWPLVIALSALTAFLAVRYLREEFSGPRPVALAPRKSGLAHILAEKPWHVYATAAIVGALGVLAWPLSAATGRNDGLGITTPSSNLANYVVTGDTERFDWGVLLVLGILVGSFIAAKASGEFRLRVPDATQGARSVVGGIFMGVGAAWAGGCTVGNGMVQTSLFSYQGWLALASIAAGVAIAAKLWLKPSAPSLNDVPSTPSTTNDTAVSAAPVASAGPVASAATSSVSLPSSDGAAGTEASPLAGAFAVAPVALLDRSVVKQEDGKLKPLGNGRYELDTVGAVCPFPLIEAKDAIGKIEVGEELVIPFDCTQATDAIPRWAAKDGHEVTNFEQTGEAGWTISVRRGK